MLFLIVQRDVPGDTTERRQDARAAHVRYLDQHRGQVLLAGPMTDPETGARLGSITMLSAETLAQAEAYVRDDPFTLTGLFGSTEIVTLRAGSFNPEVHASTTGA